MRKRPAKIDGAAAEAALDRVVVRVANGQPAGISRGALFALALMVGAIDEAASLTATADAPPPSVTTSPR